MNMDITWTVIVMAALLQGTRTESDETIQQLNNPTTVSTIPTSIPHTSSSGEPTTQKQTEPTTTISTSTGLQNNPIVSSSQTNPTVPSSQTNPTDTTSITNLIGTAPITNPTSRPLITNPIVTTSITNPIGTNAITNPTSTTSKTNPTGTTSITNPTVTTSVNNPTGTTSLTNPVGTTSKTNPTSKTLITNPTDSNLQPIPRGTTGLSPTSTQVMSSPVEPTTITRRLSALPGDLSTTTVLTTLEEKHPPGSNTKDTTPHTLNSESVNPTASISTVPHKHLTPPEHTSTVLTPSENSMRTSIPRTPKNITVFDLSKSNEKSVLSQACKTLGQELQGNCSVHVETAGKRVTVTLTINADQLIPTDFYKPSEEQKEDISKETIPDTLIAILASCGALVLILCLFAAYCTYHRRSYRKNQQHLTEELQTVENGYHDNPTLEVMEVQPEMQEKKVALNGEFNDSWIVPIDNLLKEDIADEEDTHL